MEYTIEKIVDNAKKTEYAGIILNKLPEWFGNREALENYVNTVCDYPFWAAFGNDKCVGFFSAKIHYSRTGDIYVCGIDPACHGKGIGTSLYNETEKYFRQNGCDHVIVKTLSETAKDKNYLKTKKFYQKMGFSELITLTEMWDEENPCLIMLKCLR